MSFHPPPRVRRRGRARVSAVGGASRRCKLDDAGGEDFHRQTRFARHLLARERGEGKLVIYSPLPPICLSLANTASTLSSSDFFAAAVLGSASALPSARW